MYGPVAAENRPVRGWGCFRVAIDSHDLHPRPEPGGAIVRQYPSFEIEASELAFAALRNDMSTIHFGGAHGQTWLRDRYGNTFALNVNQRDLEYKFEVFSLALPSHSELTEQAAAWKPPTLDDQMDERLRAIYSTRPSVPLLPDAFQPWPFVHWRAEVLRRVEFIIEDVDVEGTFGTGPHNMQSAAPPGSVPSEASAACEVAVGLLFTGAENDRLLLAADWMPFSLIVSRDPGEIERFIDVCEAIEI